MKKVICILLVVLCMVGCLAGCTPAENVNHNLSQAADNFEVVRKITNRLYRIGDGRSYVYLQ